MYKVLCVDCTQIYKRAGCFLLYIPPYLREQRRKVHCFHCKERREHGSSVNAEMPIKTVRVVA